MITPIDARTIQVLSTYSAYTQYRWSQKPAEDIRDYYFDLSLPMTDNGSYVASYTVSELNVITDNFLVQPSAIDLTSPNIVKLLISGGTTGIDYGLRITAMTASGISFTYDVYIFIAEVGAEQALPL